MIILEVVSAVFLAPGVAWLLRFALAQKAKIKSSLWNYMYSLGITFAVTFGFTLAMRFLPLDNIVWSSFYGSPILFAAQPMPGLGR